MKDTSFIQTNRDYPISIQSLMIGQCEVSDSDIPSGSGGINGERYTYGQLRHSPVIPELMHNISNVTLHRYAKECNGRNASVVFF